MALSKTAVAALLLAVAVLAASPASAQSQSTKPNPSPTNCLKKVTVQNQCAHDLTLTQELLHNSPRLFEGHQHTVRGHGHAEFPVCWFNGQLLTDGAANLKFRLTDSGSCTYWLKTQQSSWRPVVPVLVTPNGHGDDCHAIECPRVGHRCSTYNVPTGMCSHVREISVIYCHNDV